MIQNSNNNKIIKRVDLIIPTFNTVKLNSERFCALIESDHPYSTI